MEEGRDKATVEGQMETSDISGARTLVYGSLVVVVALAVLGVVFSPENTVSILGFCGLAVTGLFTHLSSLKQAEKQDVKLDAVANKAEVAAAKVEEVKTTLVQSDAKNDAKLNKIDNAVGEVYHLSNSAMRVQLQLNAELSRWKANEKPERPEYEAAAVAAEKLLTDHDAQQALADAKKDQHVQKVKIVDPEVMKVEQVVKE